MGDERSEWPRCRRAVHELRGRRVDSATTPTRPLPPA